MSFTFKPENLAVHYKTKETENVLFSELPLLNLKNLPQDERYLTSIWHHEDGHPPEEIKDRYKFPIDWNTLCGVVNNAIFDLNEKPIIYLTSEQAKKLINNEYS